MSGDPDAIKVDDRHLAGIAFREVVTVSINYQEGDLPSGAGEVQWSDVLPRFEIATRLTVAEDRRSCVVNLRGRLSGSERWALSGEVRGRFEAFDSPAIEGDSLGIEEFGRLQALAILMPFLRQLLASATQASSLGPCLIPPINVANLVRDAGS